MSNPSTHDPLSAKLAPYGIALDTPTLKNLAAAVCEAYTAYTAWENSTWGTYAPALDGFDVVEHLWVEEGISTPFGFIACSDDYNIVAMRGTQTAVETGYDVSGWGSLTALPSGMSGSVQPELWNFYATALTGTTLATSIQNSIAAIPAQYQGKPWFFTAHSLGGPMATYAALQATADGWYPGSSVVPTLVTFGSLHAGDATFAANFTSYPAPPNNDPKLIPALRIANLSDFVPSLVSLEPSAESSSTTPRYVHAGLPFTFLWQKWDDWGNHSMFETYQKVVDNHTGVLTISGCQDGPYAAPCP